MESIQIRYQKEAKPKLKEEFNLGNELALPTLEKVVLNTGAAEALSNSEVLEKIKEQMAQITGQRPRITRAKKAISTFKLRANDPIGVMVTLRGKKAWDFLAKFISIVAPRMRDFRGMPTGNFDKFGNYNFGLTEQILFPEVDYAKIDKVRGLVISLVFKNGNKEKSKRLLELLGMPFAKN